MMIALFRYFSWPLISCRSSGIDVKPSSANITTPMGIAKFGVLHVIRFDVLSSGANLAKIPRMIAMIAMTPHVSIFFKPFNPSFSNSVMTSQNMIPKTSGGMLPGISCARDWPSPIR